MILLSLYDPCPFSNSMSDMIMPLIRIICLVGVQPRFGYTKNKTDNMKNMTKEVIIAKRLANKICLSSSVGKSWWSPVLVSFSQVYFNMRTIGLYACRVIIITITNLTWPEPDRRKTRWKGIIARWTLQLNSFDGNWPVFWLSETLWDLKFNLRKMQLNAFSKVLNYPKSHFLIQSDKKRGLKGTFYYCMIG